MDDGRTIGEARMADGDSGLVGCIECDEGDRCDAIR